MTGCKLCQIAEMNDRDFYLQWYAKRLSKFKLQHAPNYLFFHQQRLSNYFLKKTLDKIFLEIKREKKSRQKKREN